MTEVRFYHLVTKSIGEALPEILEKAVSQKRRVVVRVSDKTLMEELNKGLWTYKQSSFLPHGADGDDHAEDQPVWLTTGSDNPNGAEILVLVGGVTADDVDSFSLCCEMLEDHNKEQITAARERWKSYKDAGHDLTYWQQTASGGWEKKAA